jgi:hypothetical protein
MLMAFYFLYLTEQFLRILLLILKDILYIHKLNVNEKKRKELNY